MRWTDSTLLRGSLACMAASVALAMANLWRPTPEGGFLLFAAGTPLLVAGVAGYLAVVLRDLRRHGVI